MTTHLSPSSSPIPVLVAAAVAMLGTVVIWMKKVIKTPHIVNHGEDLKFVAMTPGSRSTSASPAPSSNEVDRSPLHHLVTSRAMRPVPVPSPGPANVLPNVFRIVLTGGPRGGKASLASLVETRLTEMNIDVYMVPEVPTLLLNAGARYTSDNAKQLLAFEIGLTQLQIQMEDTFLKIASSTGRSSVILFDRGLCDFSAFVPRELWEQVINADDWTSSAFAGILDRYDLILHLQSAALGAEKFFTTSTRNEPTAEDLKEARDLEARVLVSWTGHPHRRIVDNSTDFAKKLDRGLAHVIELVINSRLLL